MATSLLKETEPKSLMTELERVIPKMVEEELSRIIGSIEKIVERRVRKRLGKIKTRILETVRFGMPEISIAVTFGGAEKSDES